MEIKNTIFGDGSVQALVNFSEKDLPPKLAWATALMLAEIEEKGKLFEAKRTELVKKYGEKQDDGSIKVNPATEAGRNFGKEYTELLDLDTTYGFKKPVVDLDELEKRNLAIRPLDLLKLQRFLDVRNG